MAERMMDGFSVILEKSNFSAGIRQMDSAALQPRLCGI
jgi:hypothetical protein